MKPITISNSDIVVVESPKTSSRPAQTQSERAPTTWGDYFDYYVVEEYQGDSVAGYLGHKLTGAGFVFGSVMASPLLATGCTAEEDTVQGFTVVNKGDAADAGTTDVGSSDTGQPRADVGVDAGLDADLAGDADMSQPDDGMTLVDAEQDGGTDANDVAVADGDAETIEVEVKDAGLDDGPIGTDAAADEGVAPEIKDGDIETPDAFDADLDNGTPGTDAGLDADADGVTDAIAPPPDGDAAIDQSTDDGTAETDVCSGKPTCTAGPGSVVKKDEKGKEYIEVAANEGKPANVTFLMSGTNYDCTNPTLPAKELPGEATPVTIQYSAKQTTSFDQTCTVYLCNDGSLTAECPPVKVNVNYAPTINKLKGPIGLGILPSGNQCFNAANALQFTWDASDMNKDPLSCTVNVTETTGGKSAATVSVTQAAGAAMTANIPANSLKPRTDYCWDLSCSDGKSAAVVAGGNTCFTTSEKGLIGWWRFDEKNGLIAHDSSGNGLDGELTGFDPTVAWQNGSLFFNGKTTYVQIKNDPYKEIASLKIETRLKMGFPPSDNYQIIINKMGNPDGIILLSIEPAQFLANPQTLVFVVCPPNVSCEYKNVAQSLQGMDNQFHTVSGIFDGSAVSLFIDNVLQQTKVNPKGVVPAPQPFIIGDWFTGINNPTTKRPFFGNIDYMVLWDYQNTCK